MASVEQFNFGKNWKSFSEKALTKTHIDGARVDFDKLFEDIELNQKTFLDIGSGQGLSLLIASEKGAQTVGNDINPLSEEIVRDNHKRFFKTDMHLPKIVTGSILEQETHNTIKEHTTSGCFDIVHTWGVLHHTGQMWKAIDIASSLVNNNGYFILAIYNKHITSPLWKVLKVVYNFSPVWCQKIYTRLFVGLKKMLSQGKDNRERGMDLYFDAIDWLGGHPYEYASINELESYMTTKGFKLRKSIPTQGWTGCNEFVFKKL